MESNAFPSLPPADPTLTNTACPSYIQRTIHRFRIGGGTSGQFVVQLRDLLRGRLQVATLVTLFPVAVFFSLDVLRPQTGGMHFSIAVALQLLSFLVNIALAALLWSRCELSLKQLRLIELALFGMFVVYCSWLQYGYTHRGWIDALSDHGRNDEVLRVLSFGLVIRWFSLIIIYGVFIPNTWPRCALVVGSTALLPLVITGATAWGTGQIHQDMVVSLFDMAVLLLTACMIAVFGSYGIHALQTKAFEAQQLGQYKLKRKIGTGGMGDVYLAEHLLLRRRCAVKLIRPDQAGDAPTLERFEREVRAMATLTHWNTVEIFDYGHAEDGTFYFVMEYLPGPNLEALVNQFGPLPPERGVYILRQVCRALREAHGVGLLHRDIKPSNIIACERGGIYDVAKLLDFGLVQDSKLSSPMPKITLQGAILGSPPYMSPEQALGRKDIDARSDIYAVGAVAYFLLTGQPPFPRETPMQMLLAHAYEPPVPLRDTHPEIPADVEEIVMRCLRKEPNERYGDVIVLEKAFAACGLAELWTEDMAANWWRERPGALLETKEEIEQQTIVTAPK